MSHVQAVLVGSNIFASELVFWFWGRLSTRKAVNLNPYMPRILYTLNLNTPYKVLWDRGLNPLLGAVQLHLGPDWDVAGGAPGGLLQGMVPIRA